MTTQTQHGPLGPPEIIEVADRTYAFLQPDGSWWINNAGFLVGDTSVISIDTCSTERRTRRYRACIESVTSSPVRTLVNTHHHGDHTFGNFVFDQAVVIGHEACRTELLEAGLPVNRDWWTPVDWGDIVLTPPTVTFTDRLRLWSDDQPIEVSYVGRPAHTTNDCLVWIPDQRVLFCGDLLFNGGTPFLLMGSVTGAVEVLRHVLRPIDAAVIVPGHGAPCGRDLIDTTLDYLLFVLETARRGQASGLSPLETALETDLGDYAGWLDRERLVGNLHRAYSDLEPSYPPIDIASVFADMLTYNGGRPLPCLA